MMEMLKVENLVKSFGNIDVLKGVSFSLEKGEVLSILGSSGGGKTTLLRCLNFLEVAGSGEIFVDGACIFSAKEKEKPIIQSNMQSVFGMVFQQFNLFPQYTAKENICLAPKLLIKKKKISRAEKAVEMKEAEARADQLLEATGLTEKANAYPCALSGGQQQRVAIARALAQRPKILCFDEPTSALDPELTGEVLKVIRSLKNKNRTMVVVTHEIDFARSVSDKIIFMADGVIEEMGTPSEVIDNPQSEKAKAFFGCRDREVLTQENPAESQNSASFE